MSDYIAYHFKVNPLVPGVEILIAELGLAGFESFIEAEDGLSAFIQKEQWQDAILKDIQILDSKEFQITYEIENIAQTNWNEQWESGFNTIVVDDVCTVRAPFHDEPKTEYDIIIEPKMSFGTGHHETTHMMIKQVLDIDLKGKDVLDMGCGTGILAILAEMSGARSIDAIDIDNWSYLNCIENAKRNNCKNITVKEGDASLLEDQTYDVILANINRNVLMNDIPKYSGHLGKNGILVLSGFYDNDIKMIENACSKHMLKMVKKLERNNWVSLKFIN
ncbi:MAG: 50S ribosomal protein L11 methyltransferase [Flavobacteriaceae bacterium]|nr:MAG: 50S ribosomal protein L11 methyltransferase [Flavobacteriaceae bacterium]